MKDGPKSLRASHSRIASSTSQSFAFTRLSSALSLSSITRSTSPRRTARKAVSSCVTFSSWPGFLRRSDFISRMVILSISSPTEIGTRMSWGGMSRGLMPRPRPLPSHRSRAAPSMPARRRAPSSLRGATVSSGGTWDGGRSSGAVSVVAMIGNEFQQRAVGVAEIDAGAGALGAEALDRPGVDRDPATLKVGDGVGNRPVPLEAKVAVARLDRKPRHLGRMKARSMQIELRGAEPIGPPLRAPNELGAEHIAVERVRALPVRDVHHAVVERDGERHGRSSSADATSRRAGRKAAPARGDEPRGPSSLGQHGLVDPGDVAEVAAQALDLADHGGLAGLEIDRVERAAGDEPAVVLVFAGRDDVERDGAAHSHAERSHRIEHAVIGRGLRHQRAGRGIDIVKRCRLCALPRIGVGAGHDLRGPSWYLCEPSTVALPSSTLTRRLVPSEPITRSRSATGLKSTVAPTPGLSVSDILLFITAWPDLGSMVRIAPSPATP